MAFFIRTVRAGKWIYTRKLKKPIRTMSKDIGIGMLSTMLMTHDIDISHSFASTFAGDLVVVIISSVFVSSRLSSKIMSKKKSSTLPPTGKN
jgi:hypothetical protein